MKRILVLLISVGLGLGIYYAYQAIFPNDKNLILKQMQKLAEQIQFKETENPVALALRIQGLDKIISSDAHLEFQSQAANVKFTGLEELKPKMLMANQYFSNLEMEWKDIEFREEPLNGKAEVYASAMIQGKTKSSKESFIEASPFVLEFEKIDDIWLVRSMKNENVLQFR